MSKGLPNVYSIVCYIIYNIEDGNLLIRNTVLRKASTHKDAGGFA